MMGSIPRIIGRVGCVRGIEEYRSARSILDLADRKNADQSVKALPAIRLHIGEELADDCVRTGVGEQCPVGYNTRLPRCVAGNGCRRHCHHLESALQIAVSSRIQQRSEIGIVCRRRKIAVGAAHIVDADIAGDNVFGRPARIDIEQRPGCVVALRR